VKREAETAPVRWVVLIFRLPAKQASARVELWRRLRRTGALPLAGSGYVLPAQAEAIEQLQWLAATVRKCRGEAAVIESQSLGRPADKDLEQRFAAASTGSYRTLLVHARRVRRLKDPMARRRALAQLRRKLAEAANTDFFASPMRAQVETELDRMEMAMTPTGTPPSSTRPTGRFTGRTWVTRSRPKIDRCGSAWLIRKFIDPKARFVFASRPEEFPGAVPFDMFDAPRGFGHRGDDCTFETLVSAFHIRDARVAAMAEMVHDADIGDGKFGRHDVAGIAQVLAGWSQSDLSDAELLRRGMELFDGLYRGGTASATKRVKRKA
jgi:hypothetical protein